MKRVLPGVPGRFLFFLMMGGLEEGSRRLLLCVKPLGIMVSSATSFSNILSSLDDRLLVLLGCERCEVFKVDLAVFRCVCAGCVYENKLSLKN